VPVALVVAAGAVGVAGAAGDVVGADAVGAAVEVAGATVEVAVVAVWLTGVLGRPARATSAKTAAQASAPRRISRRMDLFARVNTSILFPCSKRQLTLSVHKKFAFCSEVTRVSGWRRLYPWAVLADEVTWRCRQL